MPETSSPLNLLIKRVCVYYAFTANGLFLGLGQPDRRLNFITGLMFSLQQRQAFLPSFYPLPVLP
ncbi:MAG: hypothetical protein MUO63_13070, partial [Desulfobulbaceae bacterium]|nr:hypothetical protein [Desulfobulbaceae bacterium]